MPDRDYYEVLGVARDASADAIKKAYRTQARKYHPDVNPGDKKAESRFKEVQQAYDILSDPEKRALYNNYGNAAFEGATAGPRAGAHEWTAHQAGPGSGYDQSFDFNDFFGPGGAAGAAEGDQGGGGIFEELLGRMRGGRGRQQRPTGPRPGRNVEAHLTIPFITAIRGGETKFDIEREDGKRETLAVKVPPGIESGAKLRLRGQGEPGEQGGPRGDLTIHVTVEPHPYFTRDGRNLSVDVPISVSEAILGAKIEVPTLDGTKSLPIPPGTSSGQKLRLRGQGVPEAGGSLRGTCSSSPRLPFRRRSTRPANALSKSSPNGIRSTRVKGSGDLNRGKPNRTRLTDRGLRPTMIPTIRIIPRDVVAEKLAIAPAVLIRYEDRGLVHAVREGDVEGYSPTEVRRIWTILSFQRDLGINLAGVETILKLRDQMAQVHRRLDSFTRELRDLIERDSGSDFDSGSDVETDA